MIMEIGNVAKLHRFEPENISFQLVKLLQMLTVVYLCVSVPLALLTDSADRPRTFRQEAAREGGRGGEMTPGLGSPTSLP